MKIFLATASPDEVRWATESSLAEGVVVTPTQLAEAVSRRGGSTRDLLAEICEVAPVPVCAAVRSVAGADIYRDGRKLAKISDQILVQVPLVEDAIPAIGRLRSEGVRVVANLVFTPAQALLAAKAGAYMVQVPVDELDQIGEDGAAVVREVRGIFSLHAMECDVVADCPAHGAQFSRCAGAGADVITVTTDVLHNLLLHPLTDRGMDRLLRELSEHSHPQATV